jgi:hypothetical protein
MNLCLPTPMNALLLRVSCIRCEVATSMLTKVLLEKIGKKRFFDIPAIAFSQLNELTRKKNPIEFDRWLNSVRERIEGVFHEIQNTGRNIERLLAKTVIGLTTRIIAKMTSHLLKFILRKFHGIDVQTFTQTV